MKLNNKLPPKVQKRINKQVTLLLKEFSKINWTKVHVGITPEKQCNTDSKSLTGRPIRCCQQKYVCFPLHTHTG
jgi:hypothetical protein